MTIFYSNFCTTKSVGGYYSTNVKTIAREANRLTCLWTLVSWSRLFSRNDIFCLWAWLLMLLSSSSSWPLPCDCNFNKTSHSTFSSYVRLINPTAGKDKFHGLYLSRLILFYNDAVDGHLYLHTFCMFIRFKFQLTITELNAQSTVHTVNNFWQQRQLHIFDLIQSIRLDIYRVSNFLFPRSALYLSRELIFSNPGTSITFSRDLRS